MKYEHLLHKPFKWGQSDCLSLFRDFYKDNFGIEIQNYARPNHWSSDKIDLMRLCYEREGFEMITDWKQKDLRPGDVLCVAIGESNPNHFIIYIGDNEVVHHLWGRMSRKDPLAGYMLHQCCFILRHPDVPDLRPVYPDVMMDDLIDAARAAPTG